jgi:hypothetical protein
VKDATQTISNSIRTRAGPGGDEDGNVEATNDLCEDYSCCKVSQNEECSLKNMTVDETVLVLPGGKTRCIFSYSTDFGNISSVNFRHIFDKNYSFSSYTRSE